jgi:hypothetical protein
MGRGRRNDRMDDVAALRLAAVALAKPFDAAESVPAYISRQIQNGCRWPSY